MSTAIPHLTLLLSSIIFVCAVSFHLARKNGSVVKLYAVQSFAIAALLLVAGSETPTSTFGLLLVAIAATFAVKVVIAPTFLMRLIKRHELRFSASTYLGVPLSLLIIALLVALVHTRFFTPLAALDMSGSGLLLTALSSIFISIFVVINRKGALSEMIGVLSTENSIVAFLLFAGLEQNPGLQLGIAFDILIWTVIASVFISMIYGTFGSLDVSHMKNLKE